MAVMLPTNRRPATRISTQRLDLSGVIKGSIFWHNVRLKNSRDLADGTVVGVETPKYSTPLFRAPRSFAVEDGAEATTVEFVEIADDDSGW